MSGLRAILFLLILPTWLIGCASFSEGRKIESARHWEAIASEMVNTLEDRLALEPEAAGQAIYVRPPARDTRFTQTFHDLLISRMNRRGMIVSARDDGPGTSCTRVALHCKPLIMEYKLRTTRMRSAGREVIVSLLLFDQQRILFSESGVFYIDAADQHHYAPSAPILKVVAQ